MKFINFFFNFQNVFLEARSLETVEVTNNMPEWPIMFSSGSFFNTEGQVI